MHPKFVQILRNGSYDEGEYEIGQQWEIVYTSYNHYIRNGLLEAKREGKRTLLVYKGPNHRSNECKIIHVHPFYQIY